MRFGAGFAVRVPEGLIRVAYKNIRESAKYRFILHFQGGERCQIFFGF